MKVIKETGKVPGDLPPNVAPFFPAYLGQFFRSWFAVDTPALAANYGGPVLLIYGDLDRQVSSTEDAGLLDAALGRRGGDDHELLIVKDAGHDLKIVSGSNGVDGRLAPPASRKLRKWVADKLLASRQLKPEDCIDEVTGKIKSEAAFGVNCTSKNDCEVRSRDGRNASAMAVIDDVSTRLAACWRTNGLTDVVAEPTPPELKILFQRYQTPNAAPEMVCTLAHNKPFGADGITTAFRATCATK
jgi:hypothetical protein